MKIGNPTDFWSGVMFASVGAVFAIVAFGVKLGDNVLLAGYAMGTPARMGPGFFPFWLGVMLIAIGVAYGLKLPIPLCPAIESLQTMRLCRG